MPQAASVRYQRSGENKVDSLGYSIGSTYDEGSGSISGQVDYSSNRFGVEVVSQLSQSDPISDLRG